MTNETLGPSQDQQQIRQPEKKRRLRHVEVGQAFKPFEKINLPSEIEEYNEDPIVSTSVNFRNIILNFKLDSVFLPKVGSLLNIPLGPVKITISFEQNKNAKEGESKGMGVVKEAPLNPSVTATIKTPNQVELLKSKAIQLSIGEEIYILVVDENESDLEYADKEDIRKKVKEYGDMTIYFKNVNPDIHHYLDDADLPYDTNKLVTIEAKIIEKPKI